MLAKVKTCAINGLAAEPVDVEVQVLNGLPKFTIIGLGDGAVRESRDRVCSAVKQSGFFWPEKILVNLAPAEIRKEGSSFDLPIALGILAASGQVDSRRLEALSFHGELSLDGRIKPVRGILCAAIAAALHGVGEVVVPADNYSETTLIKELRATAASSLGELVRYLNEGCPAIPPPEPAVCWEADPVQGSMAEVWGQESAKRAMMIAAAGGHNLLMIGPPGCGKSMLAERFCGLLPALEADEKLEAVKIHSLAGLTLKGLMRGRRPFRKPHHVISEAGLIGGGSSPKPGEISLAHSGVLFLDELPEFRRCVLEALRGPLESGEVRVTRAKASLVFPARFQLIAAMNPCPCGRLGSRVEPGQKGCLCSRPAIAAYLKKLSQPILDRIDMHIELEAVPLKVLAQAVEGQGERHMEQEVQRIREARQRQLGRQGKLNGFLSGKELRANFRLQPEALLLLEQAADRQGLSARSFLRAIRMAATVADLSGRAVISRQDMAEAVGFRGLERLQRYVEGCVTAA